MNSYFVVLVLPATVGLYLRFGLLQLVFVSFLLGFAVGGFVAIMFHLLHLF